MSEKQQHTAAHMRELMEHRYGDGLYHKHNKMHITYRQHCRSHPVVIIIKDDEEDKLTEIKRSLQTRGKEVNLAQSILNDIEDWWNNEGGHGVMSIMVPSGKYKINNTIYITETEDYFHEGDLLSKA